MARTVSKEGRSRAHLGGRSVPAAVLTEAGRALVAVHGQDDQHRLLQPSRQRDALDRFAGPDLTTALETYRHAFRELQAVRARIERIVSDGAGREREAEDLTQLITLLDSVNPLPGEEESLRIESERLGHVEELARAARSASALASSALIPSGCLSILPAKYRAIIRVVTGQRQANPASAKASGFRSPTGRRPNQTNNGK